MYIVVATYSPLPCFTAIQVVSRIWALWGIVSLVPEATTQQSLQLLKLGDVKLQLNIFTLLVAWSISEVLRYSFYVFKVGTDLATACQQIEREYSTADAAHKMYQNVPSYGDIATADHHDAQELHSPRNAMLPQMLHMISW